MSAARGLLTLLIVCHAAPAFSQRIADTSHNLSVSGPGPYRSQTEDRICVFCHTPHSAPAQVPLWNRRSGASTAVGANSRTTSGGWDSTALCLSCHDGTVALGDLMRSGKSRRPTGLESTFLAGRANLGVDLSDDHPVSIDYRPETRGVGAGVGTTSSRLASRARVDLPLPDGKLQCTGCHDPHEDSISPFLHQSTQGGELCETCHEFSGTGWDWPSGSHATSDARPRGSDPWSDRKPAWKGATVADNACMNCHRPHNAASPRGLVKEVEENTCFKCHDGRVAEHDIRADSLKPYRHGVERYSGASHAGAQREEPRRTSLHVECEDCHNPHASRPDTPLVSFNPANPLGAGYSRAPEVNGSLLGVSGIDVYGQFKVEAEFEYEICFKCHGLPAKSACDNRRCGTAYRYDMERQDRLYNLRDKFDSGNPSLESYHPVERNNQTNNTEVPSLRDDTTLNRVSSMIYCTDCHSGDTSPAAGSVDAGGPHGSRHEGLLALRYEFTPQSNFAGGSDGLCFKCHSAGNLFSNESFLHREHVLDQGNACINCHDPHGSAAYPHLINFLTHARAGGKTFTITGAGSYTEPTWIDDGRYSGSCWLNCHGASHEGLNY